jgi:MinD superfamily P-loop ATPase
MKQLTIISGKGGTGKTTLTAAFASLAKKAVVADCDVDAPNLHMLLHPQVLETHPFLASKAAVVDKAKCTKCGACKGNCRFGAISEDLEVDNVACEGCGVCTLVCPVKAVSLAPRVSGEVYLSKTAYGFMSHAVLYPGNANSGKLVTTVRQNAQILAEREKCDLILVDGSPGVGCPVMASVTGADAALVVTEPTASGIHDLNRVLKLLAHFDVAPFVCVNMYDVNTNNTNKILSECKGQGVEVGGLVFD